MSGILVAPVIVVVILCIVNIRDSFVLRWSTLNHGLRLSVSLLLQKLLLLHVLLVMVNREDLISLPLDISDTERIHLAAQLFVVALVAAFLAASVAPPSELMSGALEFEGAFAGLLRDKST